MSPLIPLLAALLTPAHAEVCLFDTGRPGSKNPVVTMYELGGPVCLSQGRFVFQRRYGPSRYSENIETFVADISTDRCRAVVEGAKATVDGSGSLIMGTTMIGKQAWIWKGGGCQSFHNKVMAQKGDAEYKDVFEKLGAERLTGALSFSSDITVMVDQLEEAGKKRLK